MPKNKMLQPTNTNKKTMMNRGWLRGNSLSSILTGTATIAVMAVMAVSSAERAIAKSSQEIGQIAIPTTIQINNQFGGGSGVIVFRDGNTYKALTASHVVCERFLPTAPCRSDLTYTIRTYDGKEYAIATVETLQKGENEPDLAVVTFESSEEYPVATLGDAEQAVSGAQIYVSGFPTLGGRAGAERNHALTAGIVTGRLDNASQGYSLMYDAVTRIGMSGGPVFDSEGRAIAIHGQGDAAGRVQTDVGQEEIKTGFNAAIPMNTFIPLRSGVGLDGLSLDRTPTGDNPTARLNNPTGASDYYTRGIIRLNAGNPQAALAEFNKALEINPDYADAYFDRGNILYQLGDYQAAMADWQEALRINAQDAEAYYNLGHARVKLGDFPGAIEDWTQALARDASDAKSYFYRGRAYYAIGKIQEAIEDYSQAIEIAPNHGRAYLQRGDARADLGENTGAIEDYTKAIALDAANGFAYYNRATVQLAEGNKEAAIEDLQKAAQLFLAQGKMSLHQQVMRNLRRLQQ